MKNYFSHRSAFIDQGAKIGPGSKIWHGTHVTGSAKIGKNCTIGQNCFIAGIVGHYCKLQNNVNVYQGVTLEDWVFCGPSMTFTNVLKPRSKFPVAKNYIETLVRTGSTIGAHATILPGLTLGQWSFVAAGTVVTKDVPDFALVLGNPAKIAGWVCECGHNLPKSFKKTTCPSCLRRYLKTKNVVKPL